MPKSLLLIMIAVLALGLTACGQATEEPTAPAPEMVEEANTGAEEAEAPTEEAVEEPAEEAMEEPMEEAAGEFDNIEFVMPDGTTQTLGDMDMMDKINLVMDEGFVTRGDWDDDGDEDVAILMVNAIEEGQPVLFVAALENVDGTLQSAGMYTLDPGSDVQDIRMENGQLIVDVIRPTEDGTGYETQSVAFVPAGGQLGEPTAAAPVPVPTAVPTESAAPPPPTITFSVKPQKAVQPEGIDIHVHAFDSPAITRIELHRNGELWMEWNSPDENGVPYIHHTFKWTTSSPGSFTLVAIAKDKWGGETWTEEKKLQVDPAE
jgi:hypothetical protein